MREVRITGGGLAGLSLGIALRKRGVPVRINEALRYPRHRVCGEFISGVGPEVLERLGIDEDLADALRLTRTRWYTGKTCVLEQSLPRPALGLSRWTLDSRLAKRFNDLGGHLRTGRRES
ncbi:MAG: FAD-dependent monooxygenase, partial [Oceanipulchritudo sp.]